MKKIILAAAAVAFATPSIAAPGDEAEATGRATATIVAPISITHDGGALDFGIIIPGTNPGTVVVTQGGAGSVTGDALFVSGSLVAADSFSVTGDANRAYSILTAATGTVTSAGGTMSFDIDSPTSGTLSAGGTDSFSVGGTLNVGANQAAGIYTGTYLVTVSYN